MKNKNYQTNMWHTVLWVVLFAIGMGYLESAVVVYLREIFYAGGFKFPLASMEMHIALTEIIREAATLLMLAAIGMLAARQASGRFAFFLLAFAVWDIFYYIFLKLLLGWPQSLLTWDILFLIPVTWTGPVISPVIIAMIMIAFALLIIRFNQHAPAAYIHRREWLLLISGSTVVILSFTWDYMKYIMAQLPLRTLFAKNSGQKIMEASEHYIPASFPWLIYSAGIMIILWGISLFYRRNISNRRNSLQMPGHTAVKQT